MSETTTISSNGRSSQTTEPGSSKAVFVRTIIPFLLLQFSVGLCASLQATFYPIEARRKGATATQFGAVFGIIHLSLFIFGEPKLIFAKKIGVGKSFLCRASRLFSWIASIMTCHN